MPGSSKLLDIPHLSGCGTGETSGGEKKKLALAGLFAVNPDLWILDETIEELDSPSRIKLMRHLKENGKTVIILTSKYYDIFEEADCFCHLHDGRLSEKMSLPFNDDFIEALKRDGLIPDFSAEQRSRAGGGEILSASELVFSYGGDAGFELSIDGFSLNEGETVSLVGRNGCGKSTLGKLPLRAA